MREVLLLHLLSCASCEILTNFHKICCFFQGKMLAFYVLLFLTLMSAMTWDGNLKNNFVLLPCKLV